MRRMLTSALLSAMVCGATRVAGAQKCGQPFEVPAGTPSKDIARTVVDQMFDEIVLTDAQQAKAVDIVAKFIDDQANIARDSADRQRQVDALVKQRDADLLALLTNDADKAKLSACFKKIEAARAGGRGAPRS